jgi:hypothetical protein
MQRLRAIEQDWSTINDMRQDFESTKAKLRNLMHRELAPQSKSLPRSSRVTPEDHASHAYSPSCDKISAAQMYTQQHQPQIHGTDVALDKAADVGQDCRGMRDGSQAAGSAADECSKLAMAQV